MISVASRRPAPIGLRDHAIALLLGTVYAMELLRTASDLGYARDEGFYFQAAEKSD